MTRIPILIAGGGPVGLMLAAELGRRGVRCLLVDQEDGVSRFAKIMQINVRTMELCRSLGVSQLLIDAFPPDFPLDNVFVTSLTGCLLARAPLASMGERRPSAFIPEFLVHCPHSMFDP